MSTRPSISESEIRQIVEEKYALKITKSKELVSFEDRNFKISTRSSIEVSETDKAAKPEDDMPTPDNVYIVKVMNSRNCELEVLEFRRQIMSYLEDDGFRCTQILPTTDGNWVNFKNTENLDKSYNIQLMTYIPGSTLNEHISSVNSETIYQLGEFVGKLHRSLKLLSTADKAILERSDDPWILENFHLLAKLVPTVENEEKRAVIGKIIQMFITEIKLEFDQLTKGIIHNDLHDLNIIVNCQNGEFKPICGKGDSLLDTKTLFGIIDFNDVTISFYILEVAMVIRDLMTDVMTVDSIDIAAHFLAGYLQEQPLHQNELNVLYTSILAGLCQYIVLGEHEFKHQPNNEYTKFGSESAWIQLQKLWTLSKSSVINRWENILKDEYNIIININI